MQTNLLLGTLPRQEHERLQPFLKHVELKSSFVLIEPNEPIKHVYFPDTFVSSTLQALNNGDTVEAGLMGVEGLVGIQLWLRERSTPSRTIVQVPGEARRMSAEDFIREVRDNPPSALNTLIARYTHAFLVMTSQTAACNRLHEVDVRLCRWLKMTHNRVGRDEFPLRQEFVAQMLGVSRPTVSIAAKTLQKAGLIDYSRGNMRIMDADGLRSGACECYNIMEKQIAHIFDEEWAKRVGARE